MSDILREMKEIEVDLSAGSSPVGHPPFHSINFNISNPVAKSGIVFF